MRRGHSGTGPWRNENHRHFGPRSGGTPHFRPSRPYGSSEGPRFPPFGPRFRGHERYRAPSGPRSSHYPHVERPHHSRDNRQMLPLLSQMRQKDNDQNYNKSNYYEENQYSTNVMGDVDLRQSSSGPSNTFNPRPMAPDQWHVNSLYENRHYFNDHRSPHKTPRHQNTNDSMPLHDYTGHRPPASDHYAAPPGPNNNNTPYSRSVDDTVDIVRKRIKNRDSQQHSNESSEPLANNEDLRVNPNKDYHVHHEQPVKKKAQKLKPINKSNCDKMKNKIVHQLFKMDKGKIHKLMDNPSSSSKFEYAISSLITESQNSLNRHLRSVAEKSLCNSSAEFINNDNNTIYEDTFMKQMQCLLDPQDTVLLEDIKPLVLAELSKVLQLDDLNSFQSEDYGSYSKNEHSDHQYYNENNDQYSDQNYYEAEYLEENAGNSREFPDTDYTESSSYSQEKHSFEDAKPLFERRPLKREDYSGEIFRSTDSRQSDYSQERFKIADIEQSDSNQERLNKNLDSHQTHYSQEKLKSAESRRSRISMDRLNNDKNNEMAQTLPDYSQEKLKSAESRRSRISMDRPNNDKINEIAQPLPDYTQEKHKSAESRRSKISMDRPNNDKNNEMAQTLPDYSQEKLKSAESRRSRISMDRPNNDKINEIAQPLPDYSQEKLKSAESRRSRISIDRPNDNIDDPSPAPVFDPNVEQLSEEDDPFADLDNQYHVAVDHTFIETEDIVSLISPSPVKSPLRNSPPRRSIKINSPKTSINIKNEIDSQLQTMAQSPLEKLFKDTNYVKKEQESNRVKGEQTKTHATPTEQLSVERIVAAKSEFNKTEFNNTDPNTTKSFQPNSRKRSIDQKPSHRKEKRKKNSISESQDASKSTFNLFFSNIETKDTSKSFKKEVADKNYSEKYVKRKDTSKKSKEHESSKSEHKKQNESSHSMLSPSDSAKQDSKTKLKSIDLFSDQPKKAAAHQSHRNTAAPVVTVKSPDENKLKVIPLVQTSFARKLVKRHVGTQVVKKFREKVIQTDKQKYVVKATQTDPVAFSSEKPKSVSKDPFERMKEIDLEIQVLLQEKFKLYNSLESKNANGGNTIETLGMTVLNMPIESTEDTSSINEDTIVDDFANIPVEELEQIAMETVEDSKRRPKRKITHTRKTSVRSNRKLKPPNISLLEQIITDDRPIEDIISLDDFETTPVKSKKKPQKSIPKKKSYKKTVSKQIPPTTSELHKFYNIKDCSVILIRTDVTKYLNRETSSDSMAIENLMSEEIRPKEEIKDKFESVTDKFEVNVKIEDIGTSTEVSLEQASQIVEEVVNDLQFDMLDVSEDIIIGDNCELKSGKENERLQITEEIILDNSQSSIEDTVQEAGSSNECKMYDYSNDENLRQDSMTVVGNADAVLAIECIENDFIAACLDGNVYHFSADGQLVNTLRGSNLAVTCLTIVKEKYGTTVYTGSLDSRIRYYDLETGLEKGPECNVLSPIQTMDLAWDTVFVGTRTGFVLQFECKNNMLIPVSTVKFSEQSILALRAMKEGPRKVLLVAARSEDVTVKDAQTGLLLRTLSGPKMTVYTLLFEDGKVYCGTSSPQIHVFDYTSGSHVGYHEGGKGAVCLRAIGGLVFAGCYDGCVYVYREGEPRALAQLRGPSLMLLSLAVRGSKIIAGYKDRSLYIWKIPLAILKEMIL